MTHKWNCANCGYVVDADTPPEVCPSCKQNCVFIDTACYTPYCGGPDSENIDPRVVQANKDRNQAVSRHAGIRGFEDS